VRVAAVGHAEGGESLAVQRRRLEGRARELGKKLSQIFVEKGISGAKPLERRPQGRALLRAAKPRDMIIATKLDRMFRSASDALRVIEVLRRRKISLYLLDLGGDCTGDGIATLVVTIVGAVAEFERHRARERILEVVAGRRKRGLPLGGVRAPFGFKVDARGKLRRLRKEQSAIRLIKLLHSRGYSLREIAQRVVRSRGLAVSHMTVQAVLRREALRRA
jgi:putative DNA-invertase from lambdoid prophage Rac